MADKTNFMRMVGCVAPAALVAGFALSSTVFAAEPQRVWMDNADKEVWRNPYGECWEGADGKMGVCDAAIVVAQQPAPPPQPPRSVAQDIVLNAGVDYFDFDKSILKPKMRALLDDLAPKLKDPNISTISIVGHTDNRGKDAYNMRLSKRRADAVREYLAQHGVSTRKMTTDGRGFHEPAADNRTDEGRARNRRVEIHVR
ncbi:MAG: OmpA family protein [Pseudomonadota bacterium]